MQVSRLRISFLARICMQVGGTFAVSAATAYAAAGDADPLVQPLAGWLIGVLVILVISILSRHRPSKIGQEQVKSSARGER